MLCFRKFPVAKKFMDKGGGGKHDFPSKTFCLTVPTSLGHRKNLCFRGLCHDFPSKLLCLTVPKNSVGEPFVSLISGIEKFYASEGYVTIFRQNCFVSQHRKIP